MRITFDLLGGVETRTLDFRAPRQSSVINRMAESAEIHERMEEAREGGKPGLIMRVTGEGHTSALKWLTAHCETEGIDGDWLDEHVSLGDAINAASELLYSRMPTEKTVGKSETTPD